MAQYQVGRLTSAWRETDYRKVTEKRIAYDQHRKWTGIVGFDPASGDCISPDGSRRKVDLADFEPMRGHEIIKRTPSYLADIVRVCFANGDQIETFRPFWIQPLLESRA